MFFEDSQVEDDTFMEVGRIMQRSWTARWPSSSGPAVCRQPAGSEDDWHGPTLYFTSAPMALRPELPSAVARAGRCGARAPGRPQS